MKRNYDLIVIGWGKAGKTIAAKAAAKGKKVALIEKDEKMFGGTCINVGCLPTKSLVHSSKLLEQMERYGLERDYEYNDIFFKNSIAKKNEMVKKLNLKNFGLLEKNPNVDLYLGTATFLSNTEIEVDGERGEGIISAEKILINTGSTPRTLSIKGCDSENIIYSEAALNLETLPEKLLIIGAGYIGLEFSSYFANFGSEVTVFQSDDNFLPREDKEDANMIKDVLSKKNITFKFNVTVNEFVDKETSVRVKYSKDGEECMEEFDKVLIAIGRKANTADLSLENAGVKTNEFGEIIVDEKLKTTAPNIWAAGDVKGGAQFTYISLDDSRIILPQILGIENERTINNRVVVATTTFIDPPYSRVGLNEKEAQVQNINFTKKYILTTAIPKAHVIDETAGFSKILINENDEIIGATLFHYEAHEMINILSLAIQTKIKYQMLRDFIYTHPNFTESLNDILA
ncbi:NAD(P)/FAD-dependent oxidoreductase [Fusobacterium sp.]|uniref:dihydrolipoyl dehydrogenase family protein n=1 Tax=Fusobacterium sp. TaxID=68766 RepID=UPI0025C10868|nr:NAD(P)/FAD-dependent oxidoreductase [Fusobacterium sp.]MCI7223695.1 NAD(P)/FAD-dependent oxidoreductase [Fusobacterium sp.]